MAKRILVIDDEALITISLKKLLTRQGYFGLDRGSILVYCSQFTGQVYDKAGINSVYGAGPNTQYWYLKK